MSFSKNNKRIVSKIRNTVIQRWSDRKSPINQKLHISDFNYIYQNPINVNLALILFFKDVSENKLLNNIHTVFNKLKDRIKAIGAASLRWIENHVDLKHSFTL